jgi:DNA-binding PadR family transcriptional regulator
MERGFGLGISEKDRYITELRKSGVNPEGVVSLSSLNTCRQNLGNLGLIEEIMEEGARPRTYLVITDKGRRVAQKIREIQEILEEAAVADGSWLLAKGQDRTRPQGIRGTSRLHTVFARFKNICPKLEPRGTFECGIRE